jgi:hypothetical protein
MRGGTRRSQELYGNYCLVVGLRACCTKWRELDQIAVDEPDLLNHRVVEASTPLRCKSGG